MGIVYPVFWRFVKKPQGSDFPAVKSDKESAHRSESGIVGLTDSHFTAAFYDRVHPDAAKAYIFGWRNTIAQC